MTLNRSQEDAKFTSVPITQMQVTGKIERVRYCGKIVNHNITQEIKKSACGTKQILKIDALAARAGMMLGLIMIPMLVMMMMPSLTVLRVSVVLMPMMMLLLPVDPSCRIDVLTLSHCQFIISYLLEGLLLCSSLLGLW